MANENELSATKFAALAEVSRQIITRLANKGTLVKQGSKLDITNPTNKFYLEGREIKLNKKILSNLKPEIKTVKKKSVKRIKPVDKNPNPVLEKHEVKSPKTINMDSDPSETDDDGDEPLTKQKLRIEVSKLKEQRDKLIRENAIGRAELINKKELADRLFGFIIALLKNIMGMPTGYIDDFEVAVKSKATRAEKINIITIPICEAIEETKTELKKELKRIARELKS